MALPSSLIILIPMLPLLSVELLNPLHLNTSPLAIHLTDVFRFGILLLELIAGMRALEFGKIVCQKGTVLEWMKKIQQEKKVEVLVDRELGCNYDSIDVGKMLQVTLLCTQHLPAHSPKMSEEVKMLEGYKFRR